MHKEGVRTPNIIGFSFFLETSSMEYTKHHPYIDKQYRVSKTNHRERRPNTKKTQCIMRRGR
jgi:hypothetical protein